MFNPLALLGAVTPRLVLNGALHHLRTAAREARLAAGERGRLAALAEAWRAARRRPGPPRLSPPRGVTAFAAEPRGASVTTDAGVLRVVAVADDVLLLRMAPATNFPPATSNAVVVSEDQWPAVAVEARAVGGLDLAAADAPPPVALRPGEGVVVRTGALTLSLSGSPCRLRLTGAAGQVLFDEAVAALGSPGVGFSARFGADAAFYGLGEKASALNHAGRRFELWNVDAATYTRGTDPLYLGVPFLVAQRGAQAVGLFLDDPHRAWLDVGATAPGAVDLRAAGGELRLYLLAGTPAQVLERYTWLTGRARLPPLWALGFHQSRYSYFPQARVLALAKELRRRRLPCDVLHLDIHHMDGYRCFTWHPERFPAPRAMLDELHGLGFKALCIVDPGIKVDPGYRVYDEALARRFFLTWPDGEPFTGPVWPGPCHFPDFSREEVRAWWGEQYRGLLDDGVDAFWNDMNEAALLTVPPGAGVPDVVQHAGGDHAALHNEYGALMARASAEGLRRLRPGQRPVLLTRAGWAGVQRDALHWTGDNRSTWDHLRLSLQMVLGLGYSGVPFTGPDTGGFTGGPSPELFARWMQLSSLLPFFRVHSVLGSPPQEPFAFGPRVEALSRAALERRYRLLPYLYTAAWQATQTGAPLARAMAFAFPADRRFASTDDQFMLGDALLVAPVLERGARAREVLLPEGAWHDFETGERYEGGRAVRCEAPLERLPLYARAGAVVPLWPVQQHVGERPLAELQLELRAYPGAGESLLYEDDGETPGGPHRLSRFERSARGLARRVEGALPGAPARVLVRAFGVDGPALRLRGGALGAQRREGDALCCELEAAGAFELEW